MPQQCVVGVFDSLQTARATLERLEQARFSHEDVSLVTSNVEGTLEDPHLLEAGDKSEARAAKGAGVGSLVGMLLGSPLLMLPGIGPILMAGPIAAGGVVGGLLGSMAGWGIEPENLEKYEQLVKDGAVLIMVQGEPDTVARAKEILEDSPADPVHIHARVSADAPEIDDGPQ